MASCRSRSWIVLKLGASILSGIGIAGLPGAWTADAAPAKGRQGGEDSAAVASRPAAPPVMAIVSLNQQRVTIYDQEGLVLQAPVSTGQSGYETPAGIYSVLEKQAEHYSNLYDDASMPFMQRLTWSGIALHAGALPGYPASHGCIRMPLGFAERLFGRTKLGMRVIIVRDDITPTEFAHPVLFKPLAGDAALAGPGAAGGAADDSADKGATRLADASAAAPALPASPRRSLRAIAAQKTAAAANAATKAEEARMAARGATIEAARATKAIRRAEGLKGRAELQLRQAEQTASAASTGAATERTQQAKAAAQAAFAAADAQLNLVKSEMQPKVDQALQLRQQAKEVQEASQAAQEEAKEAARKLSPVSVFISRATQRLYVRQAREPILEASVTIADADRPLGTYVFTALAYTSGEDDLRWNVVSMYRTRNEGRQGGSKHQDNGARHAGSNAADLAGAKLALTRVAIPKEAAERISEVVGPGSSLIISDEAMSRETGKATEFIVLMSNEPQGGIKIRRRSPEAGNRYQRPAYGGSPFGWSGGSRGGFLWW
jgi:L,D-transpeptidase-like protein